MKKENQDWKKENQDWRLVSYNGHLNGKTFRLILPICLLPKRIFPNGFTFYEKSSILFLQAELSVRTFICRKIATMM